MARICQHEWQQNSTIPACMLCGKLRCQVEELEEFKQKEDARMNEYVRQMEEDEYNRIRDDHC